MTRSRLLPFPALLLAALLAVAPTAVAIGHACVGPTCAPETVAPPAETGADTEASGEDLPPCHAAATAQAAPPPPATPPSDCCDPASDDGAPPPEHRLAGCCASDVEGVTLASAPRAPEPARGLAAATPQVVALPALPAVPSRTRHGTGPPGDAPVALFTLHRALLI